MKRGTASRVFFGVDKTNEDFGGLLLLSQVTLGKKSGMFDEHKGLCVVDNVLLGKGIARVISVIIRGTSPLSLPKSIANSLSYVKAFGGTEQRNIPDNYIERQFIYMMDGSYLLTDIVPTPDCKIEFDFQTLTIASGARTYLGCRDTSGSNDGLRVAHISSGNFRIYGFGTYTDSATAVQSNTKYKFVWNNKQTTITTGGTTVFDNTFAAEGTNQTALAINGWNTAGTVDANSEGMYFYSLKIWDNQGNLIADYVPAVQKGTVPVVGFYDTVSKTFKTATAGTFAAGGEAVPTPDTPMDIVSNNGVVKVSKNLCDSNAFQSGFINPGDGTIHTNSQWLHTDYLYIGDAETYTYSFYTSVSDNAGRECAFYDKDKKFISGRTSFVLTNHVGEASKTFTVPEGAKYIRISVANLSELQKDTNVQFEAGSTATTYIPYGQIYTDGTVETIKDSLNNTATAEMLLKVGDYQDEQEILSGAVTRKVGVKVFDGTESYTKGGNCFQYTVSDRVTGKLGLYCTHFQYSTATSSTVADLCVMEYNSNTIGFRYDACADVTAFKSWLAQQYAQGTPVTVVYPLATPTTESVTGQTLQVQAGDNTLEITQASLNNLELEAKYQKRT